MTTLEEAYAACEDITRIQARNFYYGIRLLPRQKRAALCAVYALARRIDDIGDGHLPRDTKLGQLAEVRKAVETRDESDPVIAAVVDAATRFPIPLGAFCELIDGVEMDMRMDAGELSYRTFDELVTYCRCVAGSIGRLCLAVFGCESFGSKPEPNAPTYADHLGIALQQTNILRDIREDLLNGRIYLAQEDLDRFGVTLKLDEHDRLSDPDGALAELIRFAADRAARWYDDGLRLVPLLDRRSAASCAAMAGIYRHLLGRMRQEPTLVYDRRLSLSGKEKAAVAARALVMRRAG
jgi:phytoene synthase